MSLVYTVLIVIIYCFFIWDILLHEFKGLSTINSILKLVFAFFFFILLIYILPYILVSVTLIFSYMEVIYPVVLLYMLYIFLIYTFIFESELFKQYKIFIFTIVTILWLYPASFIAKAILENYIEKVALEKYGQKREININLEQIAWFPEDETACVVEGWSFEKKDFTEY